MARHHRRHEIQVDNPKLNEKQNSSRAERAKRRSAEKNLATVAHYLEKEEGQGEHHSTHNSNHSSYHRHGGGHHHQLPPNNSNTDSPNRPHSSHLHSSTRQNNNNNNNHGSTATNHSNANVAGSSGGSRKRRSSREAEPKPSRRAKRLRPDSTQQNVINETEVVAVVKPTTARQQPQWRGADNREKASHQKRSTATAKKVG